MSANNTQTHHSRVPRKSSMAKGLQNRTSWTGSYVKAIEFPADGPGRVIVRLERLMGSDRIRITDAKYMTTLLQRLQEEEEVTWQKRTRERRKAENNRFRQLVIDGHTEPTQAMEDLYNHPVFRVNRILNRLTKLNSSSTPAINLPPIVPTEPFDYDESGRVFKLYPGHFSVASLLQKTASKRNLTPSQTQVGQGESTSYIYPNKMALEEDKKRYEDDYYFDDEEAESIDKESVKGEFYSTLLNRKGSARENASPPTSPLKENFKQSPPTSPLKEHLKQSPLTSPLKEQRKQSPKSNSAGDRSLPKVVPESLKGKPTGHIGFTAAPSIMRQSVSSQKSANKKSIFIVDDTEGPEVMTLQQIQKKYGIVPDTDLGVQWKPYQSPIVDSIFHQPKRLLSLYDMGKEIVDMYDRQQQTADEYIASFRRKSEKSNRKRSNVSFEDNEVEYEDIAEEEEIQRQLQYDDDDNDTVPPLTGVDADEYFNKREEGEDDGNVLFGYDSPRNSETEEVRGSNPPTWDDLEEMVDEEPTDEGEVEAEFDENGEEIEDV